MNDVMKKTAQAMLYAKGIRRTVVRWAVTFVMLGCAYVGCAKENSSELLKTLEHGNAATVEKALSTLTNEQLDGITKNKAAPGGDFTYELTEDGKGIVITGYTGTAVSVLVIPAEIEGYPVVKVGSGVEPLYNDLVESALDDGIFEGRAKDWRSLTSVVIPTTVTKIACAAFAYSGLKNIVLPQGLKIIEANAFFQTDKLKVIVLPGSIEEIGDSVFYGCRELVSITIPNSLKSIKLGDQYVFMGCKKLPPATQQRLRELGYTNRF